MAAEVGHRVSRLIYVLNRRTGRWDLFRTGEHARFVTSVKTLAEAEAYVLADSCPDQVEEPA